MDDTLFELPPSEGSQKGGPASARPRVQRADRAQLEWRAVDLDGLLPADQRARIVWDLVAGLDLESKERTRWDSS